MSDERKKRYKKCQRWPNCGCIMRGRIVYDNCDDPVFAEKAEAKRLAAIRYAPPRIALNEHEG